MVFMHREASLCTDPQKLDRINKASEKESIL